MKIWKLIEYILIILISAMKILFIVSGAILFYRSENIVDKLIYFVMVLLFGISIYFEREKRK